MPNKSNGVRLALEYAPVGTLRPSTFNPRKHDSRALAAHRRSIDAFGMNVPVIVDAANAVVAGETYLAAAIQLGISEVPCIRVTHLNPDQLKAFQIAHARLAELGRWDDAVLGQALKDLSLADLDFSLEATGFEMAEIDLRIESLGEAEVEEVRAETLPAAASGAPVSRAGDLFQLRAHRVYCGNAIEAGAFEALMGDERATTVFSDPPFNLKILGHVSGLGAVQHREFAMASGEMSIEEFHQFLSTTCANLVRYSIDGSIHFLCMDWKHVADLVTAGGKHYSELKNICVWTKPNAGMGSLYRSQHELVAVFKAGKARHRNNIELGRHGRNRTNVWSYPGANSFGRATEEGNLPTLHPTVKPVRMVADAILDVTARGDLVLDPFVGSGTTLIAAERTGRRCYAMEIDPIYVDVAIRRWQAYSGEAAIDIATGRTFDAVAAEAAHG